MCRQCFTAKGSPVIKTLGTAPNVDRTRESSVGASRKLESCAKTRSALGPPNNGPTEQKRIGSIALLFACFFVRNLRQFRSGSLGLGALEPGAAAPVDPKVGRGACDLPEVHGAELSTVVNEESDPPGPGI